jgi:hypothetical protein
MKKQADHKNVSLLFCSFVNDAACGNDDVRFAH